MKKPSWLAGRAGQKLAEHHQVGIRCFRESAAAMDVFGVEVAEMRYRPPDEVQPSLSAAAKISSGEERGSFVTSMASFVRRPRIIVLKVAHVRQDQKISAAAVARETSSRADCWSVLRRFASYEFRQLGLVQ